MPEKFVKYKSFNDKALATELCRQLSEHNIPFEWESTEGFFDVSFAQNEILHLYYVKLKQPDFERANELVANTISQDSEQPVADYYLFSFSSEELKDVLKSPDEWNAFDQYWARKILASRNIDIDEEELGTAKIERLKELKRPWMLDKFWLFCAFAMWIVAFWFMNIYGAIGVLLTGAYISFSKKTMPDGEQVFAFSVSDRKLGKATFIAGMALSVFILLQYYGYIEFVLPL